MILPGTPLVAKSPFNNPPSLVICDKIQLNDLRIFLYSPISKSITNYLLDLSGDICMACRTPPKIHTPTFNLQSYLYHMSGDAVQSVDVRGPICIDWKQLLLYTFVRDDFVVEFKTRRRLRNKQQTLTSVYKAVDMWSRYRKK